MRILSTLVISLLFITSCEETNVYDPNSSEYVDVSIEKLDYPNPFGKDHSIQDLFISSENEMFILTDKDFSTDGSENKIYRTFDQVNWTEIEKTEAIDAENISHDNGKTFISNNFGVWMYDGSTWTNIHSNSGNASYLLSGTNGIIIPASDLLQNDSTTKQVFGFLHSSNQGASWSGNFPWDDPISDAVKINSSLFVAIKNNEIIYSRDGGLNWTTAFTLGISEVTLNKIRHAGDKLFYLSEEGYVYYSDEDPSRSELTALSAIFNVDEFHFATSRGINDIYRSEIWECFEAQGKIYFMDRLNGIFECSLDLSSISLIENLYPSIYDIEYLNGYLYYKGGTKLIRLHFDEYISEMKEKY